jgi:hypothetical protein
MAAKRKTTKKQAKPKTKVVYRTKKVYVERKGNNDDNPFGGCDYRNGNDRCNG